jgi:phosphoribosyl transferase domain
MNIKISKLVAYILFILFVIYSCILCFILNFPNLVTFSTTLTSFISLALTFYSTYLLFFEIKNSCFCSNRKLKKGSKEIAKIIDGFKPTKIVYFGFNTEKLFKKYVFSHLKGHYVPIYLEIMDRTKCVSTISSKVLFSKKYIINIENKSFKKSDRIVILDDIVKTGNTLKTIRKYLIKQGIKKENIYTCGFITDKYGYGCSGEPEYYYIRTKVKDNYKFPWRKDNDK